MHLKSSAFITAVLIRKIFENPEIGLVKGKKWVIFINLKNFKIAENNTNLHFYQNCCLIPYII